MQLYLIRHGETPWNRVNKHQTHSDGIANHLTSLGRRQAKASGRILARVDIERAYVSPLSRARETAAIVLSGRNIPVRYDTRLRELSLHFLDGMSEKEWIQRFPELGEIYSNRAIDKYRYVPRTTEYAAAVRYAKTIAQANGEPGKRLPRWESYERVVARVGPFLDEVKGDRVAIIAHSGVVSAIIGALVAGTDHLPSIESIAYLDIPYEGVIHIDRERIAVEMNTGKGWKPGLKSRRSA